MIPQLRIHSEYSFKQAYGSIAKIIERLQAIGCKTAGMVEFGGGTWGHVAWEKEMTKAGLTPAFGAEFIVRRGEKDRPTCWALATDPSALYALTTDGFRNKWYASTVTDESFAAARGVIRFAGGALTDPAAFDYIDCTPASPLAQKRALGLAARTGRPLVVTSDNYYPSPGDADSFQLIGRLVKPTPQWILSDDEMRAAFPMLSDEQWKSAVNSTHEVAERLQGVKLRRAPMIHFEGDLCALCVAGKAKRLAAGQIAEWTPVYEARLERELALIAEKDFTSYFLMVSDLVRWAKERMLVGPARGSAAGSLVCYLTAITEVDPIPYGLIFERMVDITRGGQKFTPKFLGALNDLSKTNSNAS